tara:strand:+ start:14943 stop:15107 length:165 start_codon:yes stop_codon:yes gene_type:complete
MTYKKIIDPFTEKESTKTILRKADNACIPFDDANTDYIEYKAWLEAGNTPEEAD